jgi:hypothetical protein
VQKLSQPYIFYAYAAPYEKESSSVMEREETRQEMAPLRRMSPGRLMHVLIVDDDEGLRELTRVVLERCGFAVLVAGSGPDGLKLMQDFPGCLDLLLTDVQMPFMTGPELAMRATLVRPKMKVLYMTANTDEVLASGQVNANAEILSKPFTCKILSQRVHEVLGE